MPGVKDYHSHPNGNNLKISKTLILCNLKVQISKYKIRKFAELRPKNCILAGSSGTHTVCVCTTHQNVKLMIENVRLGVLTNLLKSYKDCISKIKCNSSSIECNMGNCTSCPGDDEIRGIFLWHPFCLFLSYQ